MHLLKSYRILSILCLSVFLQCKAKIPIISNDNIDISSLTVSGQGDVSVDVFVSLSGIVAMAREINTSFVSWIDRNDTILSFSPIYIGNNTIQYQLRDLIQDFNYSFYLQRNKTIISERISIVTTGLQRISAKKGLFRSRVVCHFIPHSRADGCLIRWQKLGSQLAKKPLVLMRQFDNTASGFIQPLIPDTEYVVEGYGLLGSVQLQNFPIMLPNNLLTAELLDDDQTFSEEVTIAIVASISVLAFLAGIVLVMVILVTLQCRRQISIPTRKLNDNIETAPNICYEGVFDSSVSDACHSRNSDSVYDDIISTAGKETRAETPDYENVDPATGLPIIPRTFFPSCATLRNLRSASSPLTPQSDSNQKIPFKKCNTLRPCLLELNHIQSQNKTSKNETVLVIMEAADYEVPL